MARQGVPAIGSRRAELPFGAVRAERVGAFGRVLVVNVNAEQGTPPLHRRFAQLAAFLAPKHRRSLSDSARLQRSRKLGD
jgi:hypothetical protein